MTNHMEIQIMSDPQIIKKGLFVIAQEAESYNPLLTILQLDQVFTGDEPNWRRRESTWYLPSRHSVEGALFDPKSSAIRGKMSCGTPHCYLYYLTEENFIKVKFKIISHLFI